MLQPPLPGLQCRHHVQPGRSSKPSIDKSLQQSEQEPQERSMSMLNSLGTRDHAAPAEGTARIHP
jgi:hypothetical protein